MYANVEGSEFFRRALEAARRLPDANAGAVAEVYEALGDVQIRLGEFDGAGCPIGRHGA